MSPIQSMSANTHITVAASLQPRRFMPTPKTSVAATVVKKAKTSFGLVMSAQNASRATNRRKIVNSQRNG